MSIDISEFTIDDYDEVTALWKGAKGICLSKADSKQNIQRYLERNPGMSFVAKEKGAVIGAILSGHDGRRGYMHHLVVHYTYRHRGIGKALAEKCVSRLQDCGIRQCYHILLGKNIDAKNFWKKLGWEPRDELGLMSKII